MNTEALPLIVLTGLLSGCNIDIDSIKQGAEELKKEVESSNLKDCKDEDGKPLPEWICRKDEATDLSTDSTKN